jgi:hypothetical protein
VNSYTCFNRRYPRSELKLYNYGVILFTAPRGRRGKIPAFNTALAAAFAAVLALFPGRPVSLCAQSGDGVLGVSIEAEPVLGEAGSIWTMTILVDHSVPAEVRLQPPALPASLRPERVRILPRTDGGVRRTVVEYDFLVLRKSPFTLGPFELNVPGKRGLTLPFAVRAAGPTGSDRDPALPRLFWAASPSGVLRTGEPAEIALCYTYPPGGSLPDEARSQSAASWSYRPAPPVNAILEVLPGPPLPGPPAEGETGVLLRLRIIPLGGTALSLPETRLVLAGSPLSVPGLELRIDPGGR